jgi:hypothetical protein
MLRNFSFFITIHDALVSVDWNIFILFNFFYH